MADLVDERGISYGVVHPGQAQDTGTPMLRVVNFSAGGLDTDEVLRIDPTIAARFHRTRLVGGEVLMTLVGSVGRVAIAPTSVEGWNVARAVGVIPVRGAELTNWVATYLRAPSVQMRLSASFNTTVQTTLNLRDLAALEVVVPPEAERRAIQAVLGALDDKINSNRRLADALEDFAARVFTARFGTLVEGAVPFTDLVDIVPGRSYKSAELVDSSEVALLSLKSVAAGGGYQDGGLKPYSGVYKPQQLVATGDIVVAVTDLT